MKMCAVIERFACRAVALALMAMAVCPCWPARAFDITLDATNLGRAYEGLGAVSAGASSRLLIDYPEPERSQVLDYLFKPGYGASLQHLKVEIGGDVNSTDGTEPSHMHGRGDTNFNRGYEWWLMEQARERNPSILLDTLAWGAPGWIGNGNYFSQDMADYVATFLKGAKGAHHLDINYTGVRNESTYDTNWIVTLRSTLDANGLQNVRIVGGDEWNDGWKIVDYILANPGVSNAVAVVGAHYPSHHGSQSPPTAKTLGQPLWSSEEGIGGASWSKALSLAATYNRNYVEGKMTKSEIWSPVTAYYDNLPAAGSGLMVANSPWSGSYKVSPAIWATAHTTQFAAPGWRYLEGGGNGYLVSDGVTNGSYVTLLSTNRSDYSVVIETGSATAPQNVIFHLVNGLSTTTVHVWKTSATQYFAPQADITPAGGAFSISLAAGCIYTLTTTTGQGHGTASPPPAQPFPIPYFEDFESYSNNATPKYMSDQAGVFDVTSRADGEGQCLQQALTNSGIPWAAQFWPYTLFGNANWSDYSISSDVLVATNAFAFVMGRIGVIPGFSNPNPPGYWLAVNNNPGAWEIRSTGSNRVIASGNLAFAAGVWHRLKLSFTGDLIKAYVDGVLVGSVKDGTYASGMAAVGCDWSRGRFDNVAVIPVHRGPLNLARGAAAAASSVWNENYTPDQANDGDLATRWNSAASDVNGAWLQLDFGRPTRFNRTVISQFDDRITSFKIQAWAGATWQDLINSSTNLGASRVDVFQPVTASKVRLLAVSATTTPSIYEFGVYYDPPMTNLSAAATASASSVWQNDPTYGPDKANDNSYSTRWNAAATNATDSWLQLDFEAPVTFNKTVLWQFADRITGYEIQYWNGSSWSVAATGGQFGTAPHTDAFPPVTASKVRLYITGATNIPSIYEFQVLLDPSLLHSVMINEWMPENNGGPADPADGRFEPWFELYNPGNLSTDLEGWYLTSDPLNHFQFQIPAGYSIPAGGYLLVWADNLPPQNLPPGDLHVSFTLVGATLLGLFEPDGIQVDAVDLLPSQPGLSYGSRVDGADDILATVIPTPRASNARIKLVAMNGNPQSGKVTFVCQGLPDRVHKLVSADSLSSPSWITRAQATAQPDGQVELTDGNTAGFPQRFYQVQAP